MRAALQLSEPWDWNPPYVELEIDETAVAGGWPMTCVVTAVSDVEPAFNCVHPNLPNGSQALIGSQGDLTLRLVYDTAPALADRPVVYLRVVVPEIRSEPVLIGYGSLELLHQEDQPL